MKQLLTLFLLCFGALLFGQNYPNVKHYDEAIGSPVAEIEMLDWISGDWRGEAFGGIAEEYWSPPLGESMMCVFKLVDGDKVIFYEICTISEVDSSLVLRLKHFNNDLTGWEEKDEVQRFKLVALEDHKAYFDGFTFERIDDNHINIYVLIESDGQAEEVKFAYTRQ